MIVRDITTQDHDEVVALVDEAVGTGFFSAAQLEPGLALAAEEDGRVVGVVTGVARDAAVWPDLPQPLRAAVERLPGPPPRLLHVSELAVSPDARRRGIGTRLVATLEDAGRRRGLQAAVAVAWLPADTARPTSEGVFRRRGFADLGPAPGFYRELSVANGARCPVCGPPPCRCAARFFLKDIRMVD